MNPSLAQVLQRPDIRRGDAFAVAPAPVLASGFARLDAELPGGGWPRGALTELLTDHEGIGELGLLLPALAALTVAGQTVVLVAPPHAAHAPAWAAAGIRLDGLRLVFPRRPRAALWAGVEALRCGVELGIPVHGVDLDDMADGHYLQQVLPDPAGALARPFSFRAALAKRASSALRAGLAEAPARGAGLRGGAPGHSLCPKRRLSRRA